MSAAEWPGLEQLNCRHRIGTTAEGRWCEVILYYEPGQDQPCFCIGHYEADDGPGEFYLRAPFAVEDMPWVVAEGVW